MKAANQFLIISFATIFLLGVYGSGLCETEGYKYLHVKHVRDIHGDFNRPTEVVISKKGTVYVLDGANNIVKAFNRKGIKLFSFGSPGTGPGELQQAVGLSVDNQGNVYIADTGNQRIQIFTSKGIFFSMIDLASMQARPVEVVYSVNTDKLFVSDAKNHQIHCFNKNGALEFSWGSYGKKDGEFMYPGMADTDASGNIYVVDILNGRLQVFDATGKNQRQLGKFGIIPGTFFRPKGVVIDDQSRVYVSDSYTGIIQLFDNSGRHLAVLSEDDSAPLRLTTPLGMAIDADKKHLYVVQAELNKVSVFAIQGGL